MVLNGGVDVLEERLVAGAEVVEAGLAIQGGDEAVARTLTMATHWLS